FRVYCAVSRDGAQYRLYYGGLPEAGADGSAAEVTCCAESDDGIRWRRPNIGLYEVSGTRENNVILANSAPVSHNFCPFLDTRPGVPAAERYKALGGTSKSGLIASGPAEGRRGRRLQEAPALPAGAFDSQNLAFWSAVEGEYVCYFRTFKRIDGTGYRWISRSTSADFRHWSGPVE